MNASVFCVVILSAVTSAPADVQPSATALVVSAQANAITAQPTDAAAPAPDGAPSPASDPFYFSFAPYMWLTSISGDISVRNITVNADVDFASIIDASDSVFGLMGAIDIEYKGFVAQFNAAWSDVEFSGSRAFARNGTLSADVTMETAWIEAFGGYRFLERPLGTDTNSGRRIVLDGFVGARFTMIDVDASFTAQESVTLPDGDVLSAGQTADRDQSETWLEPFVGARVGLDLSENWSLHIRGDIGGFGISGADFAWQVAALVGYRWDLDGWSIGAFGGYRALSQDYSNDDFAWDAITHGPLLGVHFGWSF